MIAILWLLQKAEFFVILEPLNLLDSGSGGGVGDLEHFQVPESALIHQCGISTILRNEASLDPWLNDFRNTGS